MNAAGRVPCRCGATLILDPPRDRRATSSPDLLDADIVTMGYVIRVERQARAFDAVHNGLREGLGLLSPAGRDTATPDPARAARPSLLWAALGAAWDPRLVLPAAALGFAGLSARWLVRAIYPQGALGHLLELSAALAAYAVAAAISAVTTAAAMHGVVTENRPLAFGAALRTVLRRQRALLGAAVRECLLFALGAVSAVIAVASLIAIADRGGVAATLSRASAPLQVAGMLTALASLVALVGALLVHAGVTPYAAGRLGVQITVETRRLWGRRGLVPARVFAAGLGAALALALALGLAALLVDQAWATVATAVGDTAGAAPTVGRALGLDLLRALAGGVWTSFVGVAGLLGGYALGSGAPTEPVRAPEIITGTQQQLEPPPEEPAPSTRLASADVVTGLVTLPPEETSSTSVSATPSETDEGLRPTSAHTSGIRPPP